MEKQKVLDDIHRLSNDENLGIAGYNYFDIFLAEIYLGEINTQLRSLGHTLIGWLISIRDLLFSRLFIKKYKVEVIFYPTVSNHLDQMLPVADVLNQRGVSVLFIASKYRLLKKTQGKYPTAGLTIPLSFSGNAYIADSSKNEIKAESIILKNFKRWNRLIKCHVDFFNRLLKTTMPQMVVCGYDLPYEGRLTTRFFQGKKIPVCCVQHGDMSGALNPYHIVNEFYCYGPTISKLLEKSDKMGKTNFLVTGAPYLDRININNHAQKKNIPSLLGQPNKFSYLLIAFSGPGNSTTVAHHYMLIEAIYKLSQIVKDAVVVIKLHPKDKIKYYKEVSEKYPGNKVFIPSGKITKSNPSIFEWLSGCDVLITGGSATAVEAMLCKVPVVSMDFMNEFFKIDFIREKATTHITEHSSLAVNVQKLLKEAAFRSSAIQAANSYIDGYFYGRDGLSANRCADRIIGKINQAKKCAV